MKKKLFFCLFLLVFSILTLYSQEQEPKDLIIVLDTSSSMYTYYHPVTEQIIGPLLNMYLTVGDTFHLVSFSSTPSNEISKRIEGKGDIETIIARIMLMYPIDPWSDVLLSLDYLQTFLNDLPLNRKKTILFISDGIHNPPINSYYANLTNEDVIRGIESAAQKLKGNDWDFHYLQIPINPIELNEDNSVPGSTIESTQESGNIIDQTVIAENNNDTNQPTTNRIIPKVEETNDNTHIENNNSIQETEESSNHSSGIQDTIATAEPLANALPAQLEEYSNTLKAETIAANMGLIKIEYLNTDKPISTSGNLSVPIRIINTGNHTLITETSKIYINDTNRLLKKTFIKIKANSSKKTRLFISIPEGLEEGEHILSIKPVFINHQAIPETADITIFYSKSLLPLLFSRTGIITFFILGLIIALIAAFMIIMIFRRITNQSISKINSQTNNPSTENMSYQLHEDNAASSLEHKDFSNNMALPVKTADTSLSRRESQALVSQNEKRIDRELDIPDVEIKHQNKRIMLNLFVSDQNTAIGRRNIHLVKPGIRFSVGGTNSDFLIFLVPLPARIGILQFDGETCTFFPRKPQFFPETREAPITNCIGKPIKVISEKGYEMIIRFDVYEDPLKKLNSFLHSIEASINASNNS